MSSTIWSIQHISDIVSESDDDFAKFFHKNLLILMGGLQPETTCKKIKREVRRSLEFLNQIKDLRRLYNIQFADTFGDNFEL